MRDNAKVLFFTVTRVELLNTSSGVHHTFASSKERVTFVADVDFHRIFVRLCYKSVAARARYGAIY
jgi:hypothetical protein